MKIRYLFIFIVGAALGGGGGYYFHEWQAKHQTGVTARCIRIKDGDTLVVQWGREKEMTVRLAGIDTPEKKQGNKLNEQAKKFDVTVAALTYFSHLMQQLLETQLPGKTCRLEFPYGYNNRDAFGRLLAYVEVGGQDFGAMLLRRGLAYPRPEAHPRSQQYKALYEQAQREKQGIFGYRK